MTILFQVTAFSDSSGYSTLPSESSLLYALETRHNHNSEYRTRVFVAPIWEDGTSSPEPFCLFKSVVGRF